MFGRIFPKRLDNDYRGYRLGIWLLLLLLLFKTSISVNALGWNPLMSSHEVLQQADRIPLDGFGADAAKAAVLLFAVWGVTHLVLSLLGFIVAIRYRAMIPLLYLLLLADHAGRKAVVDANPIARIPATFEVPVNLIVIALLLIGLGLSLATPPGRRDGA